MNYKEHLLIEVRCAVMYHFEVLDECKSTEDKELENLRFTKFLNGLIKKYEALEVQHEKI